MNKLKLKFRRLSDGNKGYLFLALGILIGVISSRLLKNHYLDTVDLVNPKYMDKLSKTVLNYKVLLQYVQWKNIRSFVIFWIGCFTPIGIPFLAVVCSYIGFRISFFITVVIMQYGFKGILLIFGYTMPHFLLYGLITFLCIKGGYWLNKNLYQEHMMGRRNRNKFIFVQIMFILLLGFGLIIGGYIETYAGSYLLKKIVGIF